MAEGLSLAFDLYLKTFERDAPPEWRGECLQYGKLREALMLEEEGLPSNFRKLVLLEVERIDRSFLAAARQLLPEGKPATQLSSLLTFRQRFFHGPSEAQRAELLDRVTWCIQFASINGIAFRRLLETYLRLARRLPDGSWAKAYLHGDQRPAFSNGQVLAQIKVLQKLLASAAPGRACGIGF